MACLQNVNNLQGSPELTDIERKALTLNFNMHVMGEDCQSKERNYLTNLRYGEIHWLVKLQYDRL